MVLGSVLIIDILVFFLLYSILSLALHLQFGYTGILNVGIYIYPMIGGFILAIVPFRLAMIIFNVDPRLDFVADNPIVVRILNDYLTRNPLISIGVLLFTIAVVIIVAMLVSWLISYPLLRLEGAYQKIFTLALAECLRVIGLQYFPIAGGVFGIGIPNIFKWMGDFDWIGPIALTACIFAIILLLIIKLCNSPFGRLLKAIRENALAVESLGKDVTKTQKIIMVFSSAIAALVGVLYCLIFMTVTPEAFNVDDFSFWCIAMIVLGGTGNNWGVLIGVLTIIILRRISYISRNYLTFLPFDIAWLEPIMLGTLILLFLIYRSTGILPEKPTTIKKQVS
jgi:branched-chain amino acid transport system permease protein